MHCLILNRKLEAYYESNYEDIMIKSPELITQAIEGIQEEFEKNIFPEMGVKWKVYHNHIGHLEFNGCFRCHDDRHTTPKVR